jgi:hypothetical protein
MNKITKGAEYQEYLYRFGKNYKVGGGFCVPISEREKVKNKWQNKTVDYPK